MHFDLFIVVNRLTRYRPNRIEDDFDFQVYPEPNLGLPIELIDPELYEGIASYVLFIVYKDVVFTIVLGDSSG